MTQDTQSVRWLLTRNILVSIGLCFALTVLVSVLFSFDLEDQIFEKQVSVKADELIALGPTMQESGWRVVPGLEMEYFTGHDALPDQLAVRINPDWTDGEYEVSTDRDTHYHVAVRSKGDLKRYLVFNAHPYIRSVDQVIYFITAIALLGGLMLLIAMFFLLRLAGRLSGPIEAIAASVEDRSLLDTNSPRFRNTPREITLLAQAIADRDKRIEQLIQRERQFNRDVSHELRTPLSVAMGAAEILENEGRKTPLLTRLTSSLSNMQLLTEGILWLGRQPDQGEVCNAWQNCVHAADINAHLRDYENVALQIDGQRDINLPVPDAVAQVVLGNLLRNAFSYTHKGSVSICVSEGQVTIDDTGIGLTEPSNNAGFGIGLPLSERLCSHFNLEIHIVPRAGGGTSAKLSW